MNMNLTYTTSTRETDNKARIAALTALIVAEEATYLALVAQVVADPFTQQLPGGIYVSSPNDPRTNAVVLSTNLLNDYWNELNQLRNRTLDTADHVTLATIYAAK